MLSDLTKGQTQYVTGIINPTISSVFFPGSGALLHTCVQYQVQTWGEYPGKTSQQYCDPLSCGCALYQADSDHVKSFSLTFALVEYCNGHFKISFLFLCSELFHCEGDQTLSQAAQTGGGVSILGMVLDMVLGNRVQVVLLDQELDDFQNPSILNHAVLL